MTPKEHKLIEKLKEMIENQRYLYESLSIPSVEWSKYVSIREDIKKTESDLSALEQEPKGERLTDEDIDDFAFNHDNAWDESFYEGFKEGAKWARDKIVPQPPELREEYILCSAIWYKDIPINRFIDCNTLPANCDKGLVFCGARHCHCMHTMTSITGLNSTVPDVGEYVQGFLTNKNRFVNRKEAYDIAFKANQIIGPNKGHSTNLIGLTSEDLY